MTQRHESETKAGRQKSLPISLGFNPNANSAIADVKNGKIVRLRPLHFDWKYDKRISTPDSRGISLSGYESPTGPFQFGYKTRYSPNRVLYPLKWVD